MNKKTKRKLKRINALGLLGMGAKMGMSKMAENKSYQRKCYESKTYVRYENE